MVTKNGKKIKIQSFKNLKVAIGTVDNKNPKSVYFTISGWALPKINKDIKYQSIINIVEKELKQILHNNLNSGLFSTNKFIIDFDMRESGIRYGRKSYMNCDVTIYQKLNLKIQDKSIQESLNNLINIIITDVFMKSKDFEFTKNKN